MDSAAGDIVSQVTLNRLSFLGRRLSDSDVQRILSHLSKLGFVKITNACPVHNGSAELACSGCVQTLSSEDQTIQIIIDETGFVVCWHPILAEEQQKVFDDLADELQNAHPPKKIEQSSREPWVKRATRSVRNVGLLFEAINRAKTSLLSIFGNYWTRVFLLHLVLSNCAPTFNYIPLKPYLPPDDDKTTGEIDVTYFRRNGGSDDSAIACFETVGLFTYGLGHLPADMTWLPMKKPTATPGTPIVKVH